VVEPPGPIPNPEVKRRSADGIGTTGPVRVGRRQVFARHLRKKVPGSFFSGWLGSGREAICDRPRCPVSVAEQFGDGCDALGRGFSSGLRQGFQQHPLELVPADRCPFEKAGPCDHDGYAAEAEMEFFAKIP
jgi:hypothetical protein